MAMSKFCAALGTTNNENVLALANINFDFALFKYDAPKEFHGLGNSLSEQRRIAAESGTPHRIARKLGALFEQILPSTPELIASYGHRVSEISQIQAVNPKGQDKDGPFLDRVGADGTTIWAAATSGPSAMPILMLACMLARIWNGPEATSLWMEIISQRQEEIRSSCDGSKASDFASLQAANQEFSRTQLADWDASIRAWLRTADEAKLRDQRQLMLIVNNVNLPVSTNMSVYKSVVDAWKTAMTSMNNLITGIPQGVQSGALLLGLSAWHIYPDMVVHGTKEIRFQDPLVSLGGILTVGLQNMEQHDQGIYWSLPLAHLRYYGHPVKSTRKISQDVSRVSIDQLLEVTLGAVLSAWKEQPSELDILNQAQWFSDFYEFLCRAAASLDRRSPGAYHKSQKRTENARALLGSPGWVAMLMGAVNRLLASNGVEREMSIRLIAFGQRRCGKFLAEPHLHPQPFFGLSEPSNIIPLLHDNEDRIEFLRSIAMNINERDLIIRTRCKDPDSGNTWYEYASASACSLRSRKRNSSGILVPSLSHKRWISMEREMEQMERRLPRSACRCIDSCYGSDDKNSHCTCAIYYEGCIEECYCLRTVGDDKHANCYINESLIGRRKRVEIRAEKLRAKDECISIQYLSDFANKATFNAPRVRERQLESRNIKENSPYFERSILRLFTDTWETKHKPILTLALRDAPWCESSDDYEGSITSCEIEHYFGDENAAIFRLLRHNDETIVPLDLLCREDFTELFLKDAIDISRLYQYLRQDFGAYTTSLKALASAQEVYKLLPNVTIDLRITSDPLYTCSWACANSVRNESHKFSNRLSLARTFACVAHFESGSFNIDPQLLTDVIAVSSGNSIFVAAPLLCDPSELPAEHEVKRVVGNIGRAGIAMLIPPQDTKMRELVPETWNLINHTSFDGELLDSFQNTSLHLSFTPYTMSINVGDHGMQDKEAFFLESLVSVYDQEKWVADLDILKTIRDPLFSRHQNSPRCSHVIDENTYDYEDLVSIDNWDELLDKEDMTGVVRARRNWLARLAAAAVSVKQRHHTIILPNPVCWDCVELHTSKSSTTYIC